MKKQLSLFLMWMLLGWGQSAFAATPYFWVVSSVPEAGTNFPTPSAACEAYVAYRRIINPTATWSVTSVSKSSETVFSCGIRMLDQGSTNPINASVLVARSGDYCPAGGVYDSETGECDIPPCPVGQIRDTMTGLCIPAPSECKSKMGNPHQMWVDTFNFEMCISGCSVAVENAIPVKRLVGPGVSYDVDAVFTGDDCSGDTATTCSGECDISPPTESTTDTECTATVTDGEGRQQSNCQTTDIMKDNQACAARGGSVGEYQGMQTCVEANKGPKATQTTKDVKQTTETKADGGTKTTTETTTTTKNCIGIKSCTTTSTTVTNVSNTNADGTKGSESSSCKGANCGTGGKPSETPGESEEQEEEGIAGPTKSLVKTDSPGFGETGKEWEDKIAAGLQQLDGLIDKYSNLFSGAFDLNIGTGGGALPCYQIPINTRFINTTLDFCPAKYEDQLVYLKYILLACAAILAGFFVLRD